jgi:hypothetical protein
MGSQPAMRDPHVGGVVVFIRSGPRLMHTGLPGLGVRIKPRDSGAHSYIPTYDGANH